jgi:MORN repeat
VYRGNFVADKRVGLASFWFPNGDRMKVRLQAVVEGTRSRLCCARCLQVEFIDDKPGKDVFVEFAELTLANGFYRGTLYDGLGLLRHGTGVMKYNDGSVYTGTWDMNVIEGTGVMKYADGSVYDGQWHQAEYHGLGYLVMAVPFRTFDCFLGEVRPNRVCLWQRLR